MIVLFLGPQELDTVILQHKIGITNPTWGQVSN